jgi:hypothetical protein
MACGPAAVEFAAGVVASELCASAEAAARAAKRRDVRGNDRGMETSIKAVHDFAPIL